nr:uncharacterized protein LOC116157823 isoform X3 [Camelus dromedarius]XP_031324975.1 uncharacterized protein LOC116157823 isoform X4 [Camelus dromedarius]
MGVGSGQSTLGGRSKEGKGLEVAGKPGRAEPDLETSATALREALAGWGWAMNEDKMQGPGYSVKFLGVVWSAPTPSERHLAGVPLCPNPQVEPTSANRLPPGTTQRVTANTMFSWAHTFARVHNVSHCWVCTELPVDAGDGLPWHLHPASRANWSTLIRWNANRTARSPWDLRRQTIEEILQHERGNAPPPNWKDCMK